MRKMDNVPVSGNVPGRWAMAVRGFLCQNIILGCSAGGFGVAMPFLRDRYQVGAGAATLGFSLSVLTSGLFAPAVATMIGKLGLRPTMLIGAILTVIGYAALAFAPTIGIVLAAYALLIGVGGSMSGIFPSSVLVSNWFQPNPGRALGFVNMSVFVALLPLFALPVIGQYGLRGFYLMLALISALLIPVVLGVRDRPDGLHGRASPQDAETDGGGSLSTAAVLRAPIFWVSAVGFSTLAAMCIIYIAHIVSYAIERGVSGEAAITLVSVSGGAIAVGALVSGFLCDRFGPARTLALAAAVLALSWVVIGSTALLTPMLLASFLEGIAAGGIYPTLSVLTAQAFGLPSLARVLGLVSIVGLPFSFLLPPAAGLLRDLAGNYFPVIGIIIAITLAVAVGFYAVALTLERRARSALLPSDT